MNISNEWVKENAGIVDICHLKQEINVLFDIITKLMFRKNLSSLLKYHK